MSTEKKEMKKKKHAKTHHLIITVDNKDYK